MIGTDLESLKNTPFLQLFTAAGEDLWRPANPRTAEAAELQLKTDRKGQCSQAQLKLDRRMLKHPVLSQVAGQLAQDFLDLALAEGRPAEAGQLDWLKDASKWQQKFGGVTLAREHSNGHVVLTLSGGGSFLKSWFGR